MNLKQIFIAIFIALLVFTGCKEKIDERPLRIKEDGEISFCARAGYENNNPTSKTSYSGKNYTVGGKTFERVDWVIGDEIRIYCEQAHNHEVSDKYADYRIIATNNNDTKESYGKLERVNSKGGLHWGNLNEEHKFYAIYPSPNVNSYVSIKKNIISGTIPPNQAPTSITENNGNYIAEPNMNYAYLTSKVVATPAKSDEVYFSFQSISTALVLELEGAVNEKPETLTDIVISSKTQNINGSFTCNLDNISPEGYPSCSLGGSNEDRKKISVPLIKDGKGIKLVSGKKLTLTVFLLPIENLDDLDITVISTVGLKTHALGVSLKAHLKHLITNIKVPTTRNASNWISQLDDEILLSQLSILGSGNSYSYTYTGSDAKYFKAQTLDITAQWNLGVRCFEITCDRINGNDAQSLGKSKIRTSVTTTINATVKDAVDAIYSKLSSSPLEFAMVIVNYQPSYYGRNADDFLQDFHKYFNEFTTIGRAVLFRPGLTVGESRGRLMFIVRPTSDGEDALYQKIPSIKNTIENSEFLVIDGWGSLHDKWKQRGYPIEDNCATPGGDDYTKAMEQYILAESNTSTGRPSSFPNVPQKGNLNYSYQTNKNYQAWAQEWPRVVPQEIVRYVEKSFRINIWSPYQYLWVKWFESYSEKLSDAKETFNRAISDKDNSSSVYVNSLCGYFIEPNNKNTYIPCFRHKWNGSSTEVNSWGSSYGDLESFSNKINDDFYKFVLEKSNNEGITGPMGVVMMYRIGDENIPGSVYMPNVVISNNFKFPLNKN